MTDDSESKRSRAHLPLFRIAGDAYADLAEDIELALMMSDVPLFRRGDHLVTPAVREVDGADGQRTMTALLKDVRVEYLREFMNRAARFEGYNIRNRAWFPTQPPKFIADLILARSPEWRFREIAGILTAPTLDPNGRLLAEPGYDPVTRLFFTELPTLPKIAEAPDKGAAMQALAELTALLTGFDFIDQPSRAVALSAILTLVCRGALPSAPMHAISAPTPGSGKSYFFDIASVIATGRRCPVITPGRHTDEMEKRIGGVVLAGQPCVSLDNVTGVLSSALLCQILERPRVMIRLLGSSALVEIEARVTWFATGTNLRIVDDLTRRTLLGRIDTGLERPELRHFANDPVATAMRERGRYIAHCLTIVRAYIAAGQPGRLPRLASYETWSDFIRSALVWLGAADPCDTIGQMRENDPDLQDRRAVFEAWPAYDKAYRVAELITLCDPQGDMFKTEAGRMLADALQAVAPGTKGGIEPTMLGKWLGANKDRILDGKKLVQSGMWQGAVCWKIEVQNP
jgi:putative DNA primase/helicase